MRKRLKKRASLRGLVRRQGMRAPLLLREEEQSSSVASFFDLAREGESESERGLEGKERGFFSLLALLLPLPLLSSPSPSSSFFFFLRDSEPGRAWSTCELTVAGRPSSPVNRLEKKRKGKKTRLWWSSGRERERVGEERKERAGLSPHRLDFSHGASPRCVLKAAP